MNDSQFFLTNSEHIWISKEYNIDLTAMKLKVINYYLEFRISMFKITIVLWYQIFWLRNSIQSYHKSQQAIFIIWTYFTWGMSSSGLYKESITTLQMVPTSFCRVMSVFPLLLCVDWAVDISSVNIRVLVISLIALTVPSMRINNGAISMFLSEQS